MLLMYKVHIPAGGKKPFVNTFCEWSLVGKSLNESMISNLSLCCGGGGFESEALEGLLFKKINPGEQETIIRSIIVTLIDDASPHLQLQHQNKDLKQIRESAAIGRLWETSSLLAGIFAVITEKNKVNLELI